jgi:hypothetical protein
MDADPRPFMRLAGSASVVSYRPAFIHSAAFAAIRKFSVIDPLPMRNPVISRGRGRCSSVL